MKNVFWSALVLCAIIAAPLRAASPSTVNFIIDMREEIAAKRFDPTKDTVGVRSGFAPLSWDQTLVAKDEDGDGRYEIRVAFPDRPFGGQAVA